MIKIKHKISIITATLMLSSSLAYGSGTIAIGPKVGTDGIGGEVRIRLTDHLFSRIGIGYFKGSIPIKDAEEGYRLTGQLRLLVAPFMLDFHPFNDSGFRMSAGAGYNASKVGIKITSSGPVVINRKLYSAKEFGDITAELKYDSSIAGFFTIGYDNSLIKSYNSPIGFGLDVGIMYSGNLKLNVKATGKISEDKETIQEVTDRLNENVNMIRKYARVYPIISLSIKYYF